MARTVREVYNEIVEEKDKRLELKEIDSKSKVSVMNGIIWIVASAIVVFESILDVFEVDISNHINRRINGTSDFYAEALLKYQHGDELSVREDGLAFGYSNVDASKQIITKVSYSEYESDISKDNRVLYKVATGKQGQLQPITEEQLLSLKAYLNQIKFAGTNLDVVSKKGDVLLPRVTVYHNGQVPESEMLDKIDLSLKEYIESLTFDARVRKIDVINAIKSTDNVIDVYLDKTTEPKGGVYVAQYDDNGDISESVEIDRIIELTSGYLRESSKTGDEVDLPTFKECITLVVEK